MQWSTRKRAPMPQGYNGVLRDALRALLGVVAHPLSVALCVHRRRYMDVCRAKKAAQSHCAVGEENTVGSSHGMTDCEVTR